MLALLRRARDVARRPPVLLALTLAAWGVGEAFVLDGAWPLGARLAFVLVVLLPVAFMDRWPWAVVAILGAGCAVETEYGVLELSVSPLQGIIVSGWIVGAQVASPGRSVAALVGVIAVLSTTTPGLDALACGVTCGIGWAGARAVRNVRRRRAEAEAVLAALASGGPARREAAVAAERRRLARELDAAVLRAARAIEADARVAAARLEHDPDGARRALVRVAERAGEATGQMHRALMVLGAEGDALDPDGLDGAVAAVASRGVPVVVRAGRSWGRRPPAPAPDASARSSLAVARVLEVVAAGPWRPARVDVRRGRRATVVRVRTDGRAGSEERLALARIAERAERSGGRLRVRRRPGPAGGRRTAVVLLRTHGADGTGGAASGVAGALAAGLVAGALTAVDVLTGHSLPVDPSAEPSVVAIAAASGATALGVGFAWSRRTWALVLLGALGFLRAAIVGYVGLDVTTVPLMALTAYLGSAGVRGRGRRAAVLVAVAAGGSAVALTAWEGTGPTDIAVLGFTIAVPWAIGAAVRDAAADAERLASLRWATRRDDLRAVQAAVDDERRRVAADLHDLAGHGLALIGVQAWGAVQGLPADRDRARDAIAAIRRVVRSSVAELELLLRPREAPGRVPEVDALVTEASQAGVPVRLQARRDGRAVGAAAALAGLSGPGRTVARRVVQESLTNVLRHAGPVPTTVLVARSGTSVEIVVANGPGRTGAPGGGRGLAAMRDRLAALGGALEAGPTPDGGFRLRAVVPDGPAATGSAVCGGPTRPASGDAGRPPSAGPGGADERSASGCGDLAPSAVEAAGTVPG